MRGSVINLHVLLEYFTALVYAADAGCNTLMKWTNLTTTHSFLVMDAILGHRPATRPPIVVDSLESSANLDADDQEELDIAEEEGTVDFETDSVNSSTTSITESGKSSQSKKRKRTGASKQDAILVDLLEKAVSAQSKSEEMVIELEEKRMKMEERQMEREAQQRKEERKFQMQTMRLMMMGPNMHNFLQPQHVNLPNVNADQSSSSFFAFGTQCSYPYPSRPFDEDS